LRAEVRQLRRERKLLKAATVFFAEESLRDSHQPRQRRSTTPSPRTAACCGSRVAGSTLSVGVWNAPGFGRTDGCSPRSKPAMPPRGALTAARECIATYARLEKLRDAIGLPARGGRWGCAPAASVAGQSPPTATTSSRLLPTFWSATSMPKWRTASGQRTSATRARAMMDDFDVTLSDPNSRKLRCEQIAVGRNPFVPAARSVANVPGIGMSREFSPQK